MRRRTDESTRFQRARRYLGTIVDRAKGQTSFRWVRTAEPPDILQPNMVYVVGQGRHLWSAEFLCPCSCGAVVRLSLHKDGHPRWTLCQHRDGRVSLSPSVWRKVGCKSHFFITKGVVTRFRTGAGIPE